MMVRLHTGVRLFLSLGLFVSLVSLIGVIMLVASAILSPGRWHERLGTTRLVHPMEHEGVLVSM